MNDTSVPESESWSEEDKRALEAAEADPDFYTCQTCPCCGCPGMG